MLNNNVDRRLIPAEYPSRSLKSGQSNKAAQAAGFAFGSPFQQLTLFLCVIREHLFSQRISGGAPRWDIGVAFRHRDIMVALKVGKSCVNACVSGRCPEG